MKIGIVGAGNMGGAFYLALAKNFEEDLIFVFDRHTEKMAELGVQNPALDVNDLMENCDTIILAVKPQSVAELFDEVTVDVQTKLFISIMAGVSIAKIQELTGASKVVRAMPNLGVQVGKGVTGWISSPAVTLSEKKSLEEIFLAGGRSIEVADEKMLDAVAAVSGSGPAYFFYLTELLQKKAESLGFDSQAAKDMAEGTFVGSAKLFENSSRSAEDWREAVSSKGGSTIEAIKSFEADNFDEVVGRAVDAAIKRWETI